MNDVIATKMPFHKKRSQDHYADAYKNMKDNILELGSYNIC